MKSTFDQYSSTPIGSLVTRDEAQSAHYLDELLLLPKNLVSLLMSPKTGAYIRGLVTAYNLPKEKTAALAYIVLQVGFGEKNLQGLAAILQQNLSISPDQAQKISRDIEKDLFVPIMLEYNNYLAKRKKPAALTSASSPNVAHPTGARNVLDLKTQPKPPMPPAIPKKY